MPIIRTTTTIHAPIGRVFDLARSIDAHLDTAQASEERVIAGRKSGLIEYGESVTWEAKHLGRRHRLKAQVTEFDRPNQFVDEMVSGPFRSLRHVHRFRSIRDDQTEMVDEIVYRAPMGPIGMLAEKLILTGHLRKFLESRNEELRQIAECDRWRSFLPDETGK
jgi:ligand-binding SRPBCC domain-containing protein